MEKTENVDMQHNGTGAGDLGEDFGVDRVDRNETVEEVPVVNGTEQSVPASGLELGWTKEDKKIWIKCWHVSSVWSVFGSSRISTAFGLYGDL